jgi:hypothetical protein
MWNLWLGKDGQCFAKLSSWLVVIKGLNLIIFYPRFVSCDIVIRPGLDQSTHIERNRRNISHWLSFGISTDQVAMLKTPGNFGFQWHVTVRIPRSLSLTTSWRGVWEVDPRCDPGSDMAAVRNGRSNGCPWNFHRQWWEAPSWFVHKA